MTPWSRARRLASQMVAWLEKCPMLIRLFARCNTGRNVRLQNGGTSRSGRKKASYSEAARDMGADAARRQLPSRDRHAHGRRSTRSWRRRSARISK
jgi:hypothetical protein